jgi:MoxR-like ATPase
MRVRCDNLSDERLGDVLSAGWRLDMGQLERGTALDVESIRQLNAMLGDVEIAEVRPQYVELIRRLRQAGIPVSDRRAVKLQRLVAASALLCGRMQANTTDLWVLRYIWDTEQQQEVLAALVQAALDKCDQATLADSHPQARNGVGPDAETLARDLERIAERVKSAAVAPAERSVLRDQLGLLAARCQWIGDAQRRTFLERQVEALWPTLGEP